MKKLLVSILIGMLMVSVGGQAWAGSVVAADLVCTNPAGCVQTNEISDGAVTDAKITGPISSAKLGAHTHNGSDIVDGTIGTAKISDGAVTNGKIATGAVATSNIAGGAVTTGTIADGAVSATKISDGAVTTNKVVDGSVTTGKLADWSVNGAKIADFSVTDTKITSNAVTSTKVADGAITDAKITGPISASKIEKLANVVVVAKSGADFTSIADALASINPTAETPYLIKVMPGTYTENITMKSYTYLQGTGRDVTTIQSPIDQAHVITIPNLSNVTISDIAITKNGNYGSYYGVYIESSSSVAIMNNIVNGGLYIWYSLSVSIMENIIPSSSYAGIQFVNSSPLIVGNTISGNGYGIQGGANSGHYVPIISRNIIIQNGNGIFISGASWGGLNHCAPEITENIIEGNNSGISLFGSSPKIVRNIITGNQSGDLYLEPSSDYPSLPNISFNMYDTMTGTGVGAFNVKSNGTAW